MIYRVRLYNQITGHFVCTKQPKGIDEIAPTIKRNENHGLTVEIDVKLEFYCNGAGKEFIDRVREDQGVDAEVLIYIDAFCGCTPGLDAPDYSIDYSIDYSEDYGTYIGGGCDPDLADFFIGRLDLKTWTTDEIFTKVNIIPDGILQVVKNRLDTKVDLFADETLGGVALAPYAFGGYDLNMHSKKLRYQSEYNFLDDETIYPGVPAGWTLEGAETHIFAITSSPGTERTIEKSHSQTIIPAIEIVSEVQLYTGDVGSLSNSDFFPGGNAQIQAESLIVIANKGIDQYTITGKFRFGFGLVVQLQDLTPPKYFNYTVVPKLYIQTGQTIQLLQTFATVSGSTNTVAIVDINQIIIPFQEYSIDIGTITQGINDEEVIRLYMKFEETWVIERPGIGGAFGIHVIKSCFIHEDFTDSEKSFVKISQESTTPATTAKAFAIFEAAAQIARVITDQIDSFRSNYFGRKNSEPFAYLGNGCGSFGAITNGFMLRGYPTTGDKSRVISLSLNEFFRGLNPIYNLGMGIEKTGAHYHIVIEPKNYFYDSSIILLTISNVPDIKRSEAAAYYYSLINNGYEKWETEFLNGLDEFNSKRQFSTGVKSISNDLTLVSNLIAAGYRIEVTRRNRFRDTSTEDSEYDEDNIIVALNRSVSGLNVPTMLNVAEKNENFSVVNNVFSPETSYNLRLSPVRNLLRWSPVIDAGLTKYVGREIKFTSGEGNYKMSSELASDVCPGRWNNNLIAENENIIWDDVDNSDSDPIWLPEIIEFQYPLTLAQWESISANPKGVFEVSGSTNDYIKGFILELKYKPDDVSDFKLLRAFV